jgi:hypothetical protein
MTSIFDKLASEIPADVRAAELRQVGLDKTVAEQPSDAAVDLLTARLIGRGEELGIPSMDLFLQALTHNRGVLGLAAKWVDKIADVLDVGDDKTVFSFLVVSALSMAMDPKHTPEGIAEAFDFAKLLALEYQKLDNDEHARTGKCKCCATHQYEAHLACVGDEMERAIVKAGAAGERPAKAIVPLLNEMAKSGYVLPGKVAKRSAN